MKENAKRTGLKQLRSVSFILLAIVILVGLFLYDRGKAFLGKPSAGELRIVSVSPSVTEMLFVLGMQDSIVGVSDRCDYPPEAKKIEKVGGFGVPNIEKILALKPTLLIATEKIPSDAAEVLYEFDIKLIELQMRSFDEMFESLSEIGRAIGKSEQAEEFVASMKAELDVVAGGFKDIDRDKLPRVFVEIWYNPLTTAGKTSFVNNVITASGGVNVAGNLGQSYPSVNSEKVIEWDPEIIVLCYMESGGQAVARLSGRIGWSGVRAVREGRIINDIDPDILLRPGPRLIDGVKELAERFRSFQVEKIK